jgi:hypothetical protein
LLSCHCQAHSATATKQQQLQDECGSGRRAAEQRSSRFGMVRGTVSAIFDTKILCRGQNMLAPTRMLGPNWQLFDMSLTYPAAKVTYT